MLWVHLDTCSFFFSTSLNSVSLLLQADTFSLEHWKVLQTSFRATPFSTNTHTHTQCCWLTGLFLSPVHVCGEVQINSSPLYLCHSLSLPHSSQLLLFFLHHHRHFFSSPGFFFSLFPSPVSGAVVHSSNPAALQIWLWLPWRSNCECVWERERDTVCVKWVGVSCREGGTMRHLFPPSLYPTSLYLCFLSHTLSVFICAGTWEEFQF